MAIGGFVQLPDGSVIVALTLPRPVADAARGAAGAEDRAARSLHGATPPRAGAPAVRSPRRETPRRWSAHADEPHTVRAASAGARAGEEPKMRVLVHAGNRARALTRLRNLGLRAVYLNGNVEPPTADETTAVLHHPDGLVWRPRPDDDRQSWLPIAALLSPAAPRRTRAV